MDLETNFLEYILDIKTLHKLYNQVLAFVNYKVLIFTAKI